MNVTDGRLISLGYQKIADVSSATALTLPSGYTDIVMLIAEGQSIRWRDDGTNPAADTGMLLAVGVPFVYNGDLKRIRFIETTSGAELHASYYKSADRH